jgi:hypothetical protein
LKENKAAIESLPAAFSLLGSAQNALRDSIASGE